MNEHDDDYLKDVIEALKQAEKEAFYEVIALQEWKVNYAMVPFKINAFRITNAIA